MKPRWKLVIELGVSLLTLWIGAVMVADAMSDGPQWKWLGVLVVFTSLETASRAWNAL